MIGCLLGTAVGDALGLACEGMSQRRQSKVFPDVEGYHFFFGRGMISDDTEHACLTAQALIVSGGKLEPFARSLAWRLRFWLLCLPAGVGFATLRAILKLWIGFPPRKSGVFSGGNGPAMRSAIIGVAYGPDPQKLKELVKASTLITHSDPRAALGSLAVALAAHLAGLLETVPPELFLEKLTELLADEPASEFLELMKKTAASVTAGQSAAAFAEELGLGQGVTGYIYHTVPLVIQVWLARPRDFRTGILEIIRLGGDTDTTAAILGGILGARTGKAGLPQEWLDRLCEWPRSTAWIEKLGARLARVCQTNQPLPALPLFWPALPLRNLFFLGIVLAHGFRRILPPW